jgi:hypothetical protein
MRHYVIQVLEGPDMNKNWKDVEHYVVPAPNADYFDWPKVIRQNKEVSPGRSFRCLMREDKVLYTD